MMEYEFTTKLTKKKVSFASSNSCLIFAFKRESCCSYKGVCQKRNISFFCSLHLSL